MRKTRLPNMRIMIVGGNQLKYGASRYYDFASRLANGFVRDGHTVIRFSDRDMARLSTLLRSRKLGQRKANRTFIQHVGVYEPDLIVFVHADVIQPETLVRLRAEHPRAKLCQINIDPLFMPGTVRRMNTKSPFLDASFISTAGPGQRKIAGGKPAYFIPNIVDRGMDNERAFAEDNDFDVIFVCGSYDREGGDPRKTTVDHIHAKLPGIAFRHHSDFDTGGLWGAEYKRTLGRTKCGLNLSRNREGPNNLGTPEDFYLYSSDRIAHLTGNGLLTFTHSRYSLDELYGPDEMVFFASDDELVEKLAYYLENDAERRRIAENGWKKARACYNEGLVADFVLDVLVRQTLSHDYAWPTAPTL